MENHDVGKNKIALSSGLMKAYVVLISVLVVQFILFMTIRYYNDYQKSKTINALNVVSKSSKNRIDKAGHMMPPYIGKLYEAQAILKKKHPSL